MKKTFYSAALLLLTASAAFAIGDPDFELTNPQELPQWAGAHWAKGSTLKYSAKIVEEPKTAASGKRFLRVTNPHKSSVLVLAHPGIKYLPGYGLKFSCKVRGQGQVSIGLTRQGANGKNRRWTQKQATRFTRLTSEKWTQITHSYVPEEGDVAFMICLSTRDGRVDYDDFKVEMFKADTVKAAKAAPRKAVRKAPQKARRKTASASGAKKLVIFSGFETWQKGMPAGWKINDDAQKSIVRRVTYKNTSDLFGNNGVFLNGQLLMDPPMRGLAVPRSRPMRLAFYAKGENGRIRARILEGRNGFVDYIVDLIDEPTGADWKKYAAAFSLPPACRIDNATVELIGENVMIDNVEFKAAQGSDGKLIYSIPLVKTAPRIDGVAAPGEWDFATGGSDPLQLANFYSGIFKPESPALKQQNTVRFCSDGKKLYFMFEVPEGQGLKRDFFRRDDHVFLDDSVELHINPEFGNPAPKYSYQFVFNANNAAFDQRREKGGGNVEFYKWNSSTLKNKSTVANGVWTLEGSVDLAEIGLTPDKTFGLNVCSAKRNPNEVGSLNGGGFLDLGFMVKANISKKLPGVYWSKNGDWGSLMVTVSGETIPAGDYTLEYEIDSEKTAQKQKRNVHLAPGRCVPVLFNIPGGAGTFGAIKLILSDKNKRPVFRQTLDFNSSIAPTRNIRRDLEFHYLPEQKKYAINIHRRGGWAGDVEKVEISGLSDKIVTYKLSDFTDFVETLVVKAPFEPVDGKTYTISLLALDRSNTVLDSTTFKFTADQKLVPRDYSKEYKGVLPLYTPLKLKGRRADVQLRSYTFAGNGLPERISARGKEVLHAPVSLVAVNKNGQVLKGRNGRFKVISSTPEALLFTGETKFPGFTVKLSGRMEYDGAVFYTARVEAPAPVALQRLSIEVPINGLDYFQSFVDSQLRLWMCRQPKAGEYRHPSVPVWKPGMILHPQGYRRFMLLFFPNGDGEIWNSRNIVSGVLKNGFLPYLTIGNHKFGFEFFSDTDRGWVHDKNSAIHEMLRKNGKEILRTNFIAAPWKLENGRTFEFGFMATPGRERRRYFDGFYRNGYSHTGLLDQSLAGLRVKDWKHYSIQLERLKASTPIQVICKGFFPQRDPVAIYMDSEWRTRPEYTFVDSGRSISGRVYGTDLRRYHSPAGCFTPGRVNFYAERLTEFAQKAPALCGVYWDENWMKPCNNPNHAECGYVMPDGQLQGRAWWRNIREVDRRTQHIFRRNGRKEAKLIMFTGEGLIPHAFAFGTMNWLGEHPTYDMDFIDYWTPHFTEIAYAGAWGFDVGGFGMFRDPKYKARVHLNRAQLALFKLYDAYFSPVDFNPAVYRPVIEAEKRFGKTAKDVIFAGYFSEEGRRAVPGLPVHVKASLYIRPGKGALVFVSNIGTADTAVKLDFKLKEWKIGKYASFNAETRKPFDLSKKVVIKKHDFLMLELKAR